MDVSLKKEKVSASEIAVVAHSDIFSIHDRVVLDPRYVSRKPAFSNHILVLHGHNTLIREARLEFGDDVVDTLKLSKDGNYILWPQPSDRPEDPQNVCLRVDLYAYTDD